MKSFRTWIFLAGISVAGSAFAQSFTASSYTADGLNATLTDLNNLGQVTGYFTQAYVPINGFVSAPNAGAISYLAVSADSSPMLSNPIPYAINDSGIVVGKATANYTFFNTLHGNTTRTTDQAFVSGPDLNARHIGTLSASFVYDDEYYVPVQTATDINSRSDILITDTRTSSTSPDYVAQRSESGSYVLKPVPYVSDFGGVSRINDSGMVVVFSPAIVNNAKVVSPDLASAQSPKLLMGVPYAGVLGINSSGQTVGFTATSNLPQADHRAFVAESNFTAWRPLDSLTPTSLSLAMDINDSGQIVGWSQDANGINRAFITGPQGVGITDLNSLVTLSSGEYLDSAFRINEVGQILAKSNLGISYFLNPSEVPEPGSMGLMAMGLLAIGVIRAWSAASTPTPVRPTI